MAKVDIIGTSAFESTVLKAAEPVVVKFFGKT
jgi:hypothetical protein